MPAREEDSHPDLRGDKCLSRPTPLLLFVHIGKTCGDTVIAALDKNNKKITSSIEAGRAAFDMVHVHPVRAEVIASMENILITLRDPIDRFISAYNNAACLAQGTERDICERVPMKNRSPNAELIRVPELGGYTRLNRGRDFMHGMLNQLVHGSVSLTAAERLYRGRGNFTSTALFGNGLGRLLRAAGGLQYWCART